MLKMKVINQKVRRIDGSTVCLRGLSINALTSSSYYLNEGTIRWFVSNWKINAIRVSVNVDGDYGYRHLADNQKHDLMESIYKAIDACIKLDINIIIDWHITALESLELDPNSCVEFFQEIGAKYPNVNNIMYEILNEPGANISWSDIRKYSNIVIPNIRQYGENIIIVGVPQKCQHADYSVSAPLNFENVLYSMHFYAGTDKEDLREMFHNGFDLGLPIIFTQFGLSNDTFDSANNFEEANKWFSMLKEYKIGHIAWSLSNNDESAIINSYCTKLTDFKDDDYTEVGKFLFEHYKKYSELF